MGVHMNSKRKMGANKYLNIMNLYSYKMQIWYCCGEEKSSGNFAVRRAIKNILLNKMCTIQKQLFPTENTISVFKCNKSSKTFVHMVCTIR